MTIKYIHVRKKDYSIDKNGQLSDAYLPRGGYTVAYQISPPIFTYEGFHHHKVRFAIAKCSDKDNFCKQTGRNWSSRRLTGWDKLNLVTMSYEHGGEDYKEFLLPEEDWNDRIEIILDEAGLIDIYGF